MYPLYKTSRNEFVAFALSIPTRSSTNGERLQEVMTIILYSISRCQMYASGFYRVVLLDLLLNITYHYR